MDDFDLKQALSDIRKQALDHAIQIAKAHFKETSDPRVVCSIVDKLTKLKDAEIG